MKRKRSEVKGLEIEEKRKGTRRRQKEECILERGKRKRKGRRGKGSRRRVSKARSSGRMFPPGLQRYHTPIFFFLNTSVFFTRRKCTHAELLLASS